MHRDADHPAAPRRRRPAAQIGLNLTSMIDVVFLLLVYFMAATEFKLGEEIYRLDLPRRSAAATFELPREPLRIQVASTRGDGVSIRIPGFDVQLTRFDELHDFLAARLEGAGRLFEPDHPVLVEPQETSLWEHAMEAFNAAVRARYTNVSFAPPA